MTTPLKITPITLAKLAKLGITRRSDLVLHLPLRYEDETHLSPIATLQVGESAQIQGVVAHAEVTHRPHRALVCRLEDGSGEVFLRFLHFHAGIQQQLKVGKRVRAVGEVREGFYGREMVHPKCANVEDDTPLQTSLTPVYPTTAGLSQTSLRKLIANALEVIPITDTLPESLCNRLNLQDFSSSIRLLHQPTPDISAASLVAHQHPAWQRIKFDELLAQQISMRIHHRERRQRAAVAMLPRGTLTEALLAALPFSLTRAQQKVFSEISHDLSLPHPMQRLLLGDVGSGKTIVAALAALQAIENGYQVALMSPTEILAEQHFLKLSEWLTPLGITPVWLSGSLKKSAKQRATELIASGETLLAIGTHALFQKNVQFHKLGLAIVDEQHKFGVEQRLALHAKGKSSAEASLSVDISTPTLTLPLQGGGKPPEPHQLMMSATPIPRTLAMSFYADLDVSVIDELPPGRTPIVTKLVNDNRRAEVCERVRAACAKGQQAYWVCPLIEESETLELQNAQETFVNMQATFPELRVGLVHGRLDNAEKVRVMAAFKAGELDLLVATTVIEVGVDVPNASLMVIEHAERMGLAQLHQLRGRVGRGAAHSLCILLFQPPLSELARARLKIIFEHTDGFVIAQEDLQLRGPGELLGARQSGVAMLRFADLNEDGELLELARLVADELLRDDPDTCRKHLHRWIAHKHDFLHV
ncbi:MAG: ATP-dependent DNA helicase RecG [Gallionella sp.]|nr:ATP-dependent DNA helicase RecG [Gallionella sp.]